MKRYILILKICISSSSVEKRDDTEYFQSHFFLSFSRSDSSGLTRFLCCATLSLVASFLSFQLPHLLKVSDHSVSLDPLSLSLHDDLNQSLSAPTPLIPLTLLNLSLTLHSIFSPSSLLKQVTDCVVDLVHRCLFPALFR